MPGLVFALETHPGRKRPKNEDAVGYALTPWGGAFVVADGMGGHRTGEVAARLAVDTVLAHLQGTDPSPKVLLEALERANEAIYLEAQRPENRGMGTTATCLLLDLPYALIAHVGDSRAYLLRRGELALLTEDHSWVAERVRQGLLSPEEAKTHRWRNVITNALGSFPQARVDLLGLKAEPGDAFLLCTDGLSGVLEDRTLLEVLKNFPPEEAARRLVALANEWGGPDNVSALVVRLPEELPKGARPYALPLEAAGGQPVRLKLGEEPEELPTQVLEPEARRPRVAWRDALLILLWVVVVAYILLGYFRP
ncbi:PP2C family protein-serine/threonine phosphatase [Thermus thermamylovorans]|uniref:Serine/threonine-protein phosphatase n=1 Tax=Thermus thermamylovorans TaxID=2509362 RepID=A0A4Q9B4H5_9DEIN|nr:PP2C family serine/threonine-protein phosphatase [Thermus thermamylovorans]TBH20838.1 serine/threonine-protein phosphatase [Thermus thermamylovorans]